MSDCRTILNNPVLKKYLSSDLISLFLILLILCVFTGLLFSKALLSLSCIVLVALVFFVEKPSALWSSLIKNADFLLLVLLFLVYFTDVLQPGFDSKLFMGDLRNKLILLAIPLIFSSALVVKIKNFFWPYLVFILLISFTATVTFISYLADYQYFNQAILRSKPIPVFGGLNHIYFSLMLAFSTLFSACLLFFHRKEQLKFFVFRKINFASAILLYALFSGLIFLHTISAKTGLAAFYFSLLIGIVYIAVLYKKIILTLIAVLLTAGSIFLSVSIVKPLNNRWQILKEDISTYREHGDINHLSLSTRLEYWKASWIIFKQNPWLGCGNSHVENQLSEYFEKNNSVLNPANRRGPHNQYLHVLAGTGIAGFIVFISLLIFLFRSAFVNRNIVLFVFLLVCCIGFLFESVLERQVGICFFFFMTFLTRNDIFSLKESAEI